MTVLWCSVKIFISKINKVLILIQNTAVLKGILPVHWWNAALWSREGKEKLERNMDFKCRASCRSQSEPLFSLLREDLQKHPCDCQLKTVTWKLLPFPFSSCLSCCGHAEGTAGPRGWAPLGPSALLYLLHLAFLLQPGKSPLYTPLSFSSNE